MSVPITRRLPLVGREVEKNNIFQAILGQGPSILFLEGSAGIGKTVLLEEAGEMAQEHEVFFPPIVDFYDTEMHAHFALEARIAQGLDQEGKFFQAYWVARERVGRTLMRGAKSLKEQEKHLWDVFLEGYKSVVKKQRVLLRFDTAELLEYEQDSQEVKVDCEVPTQDAPSWEWLLERIGELENTAILIAARPTPAGLLRRGLVEKHGEHVLPLEIRKFSLVETESYFKSTEFGSEVVDESPEMMAKVHLLSDGQPILIALALDWLSRGSWERYIYPARLEEMRAMQAKAQQEEQDKQQGEAWQKWMEARRNFKIALVENIRTLDHKGLDMAAKYAALARKGCSAELLSLLMDISSEEADRLVGELLSLSFVKPPRGDRELFFLHDEMYDLVDEYIWRVDWPDYSEQARLDQIIIDWYTGQIESLNNRIEASQDWRERADLRSQQQLLIAERLYYQFDKDPRLGYREYSHLDEEAIESREHEWDVWLRNEALWFTSYRAWRRGQVTNVDLEEYPLRDPAWERNGQAERNPTMVHDCRRRWVNRYIARNEMEKAARIAEKLLWKSQESPHPEEPELYRGSMQIALATAQAYMGGESTEPALRNFVEGIEALESVAEEHREPWLYPYFLGTAHLYKGLALRGSLRLTEAVEDYSQATYYYRSIGYRPGLAEAMNNLAYIYAQQGRLEPARAACEEALTIRRELADEYNMGLSFNTKGIIHERMGLPITAIHNSEQALALFEEINDERGIILAKINLGRSYRRKARSVEWGRLDVDFETGRQHLEDAILRQKELGASADMFYRIEAHNELGCLYRDWVATLTEKGIRDDSRLPEFLDIAESHLKESINLATENERVLKRHAVQYADSLEDVARVYYWRQRAGLSVGSWAEQRGIDSPLQAMKTLLDQAQELAEDHLQESEELGLMVGKMHHQYARLKRAQAESEVSKRDELYHDASKHYAWAAAFLESYSLDAPELRKTVSDACDWLCALEPQEAEERIRQMDSVLNAKGRESKRLEEWVNSVVYPLLGVGWPKDE